MRRFRYAIANAIAITFLLATVAMSEAKKSKKEQKRGRSSFS
jgi:hypothetical protein